MAKKSDDRLSYGLILTVFGLIILMNKTGVLKHIPYGSQLFSVGAFFLVAGIIFLLTKSEKTIGIVFTAIGVILNADFFFGWIYSFSNLIVPIILILLGIIMIIRSR